MRTSDHSSSLLRFKQIALGDHPECTAGPPLTIGWEYCKASVTPVDVYESQRAPRRELRELQLDWIQRKRVLRSISAATDVEMLNAASEAEEVRRQRAKTVRMLTFESIEVPLQSLQRKIRRSFLREK